MTATAASVCRIYASLPEDALLRMETLHRTQAEIAAAMASLHFALAARTGPARKKAIERASRRFEAFADCLALLSSPAPGSFDLRRKLEQLTRSIWAGQHFEGSATYTVDLDTIYVQGVLGQRILIIAAELIGNALRHGVHAGGSTLRIILRRHSNDLSLTILDDGPGFNKARPFGAAQGIRIAAELAHRGGGVLYCTTDDHGASVSVQIPISPAHRTRRTTKPS